MTKACEVGRPEGATDSAFDSLVMHYRANLVAYATRLSNGDHAAAEDIVQEAYVRAWRNFAQLVSSPGSIRGWLTRVTHNIAIDRYRARQSRPTEVPASGEESLAALDSNVQVIDAIDVARALECLPTDQRVALTETILRDRTVAQAATVLGIPVGTVKSRVFYGLRRLREQRHLLAVA